MDSRRSRHLDGHRRESVSLGALGGLLKPPPAVSADVVLLESSHEAD